MPRKDYCDVTILLDRSGSMARIREGTVSGINRFIEEQRLVPGDGCWTLYQFDDPLTAGEEQFPLAVFLAKGQGEVLPLAQEAFHPRGNTALVDAACLAIDETGRRLQAMSESERPDRVLFVIMTDGLENASTRFSRADLNKRIGHQRSRYNWQFVFLGANQDAIAEAAKYGIPAQAAFTYQHTNSGGARACGVVGQGLRSWKLDGNSTGIDLLTSAAPEKSCQP